jgi:hypothetical protein
VILRQIVVFQPDEVEVGGFIGKGRIVGVSFRESLRQKTQRNHSEETQYAPECSVHK